MEFYTALVKQGGSRHLKQKQERKIWTRELTKDFEAEIPEYGYSESVLVDGNNLYVKPAGKKGYQVCLDKTTGKTIWANTDIPGTIGYNSGVINENGGYRQLVSASSNYFYGTDTRTGKLLWKVDFVNQRELNLTDAICWNDYVFLTSGYGMGCMLIRLKPASEGLSVEKVWQSTLMDNHHGGVILYNGFLYGSGSNSKGWYCLDFLTGKQAWKAEGKGSVTFADGMLYTLDERGTMRLVKATPGKYEKTGEFKVPKGGDTVPGHFRLLGGEVFFFPGGKFFFFKNINKNFFFGFFWRGFCWFFFFFIFFAERKESSFSIKLYFFFLLVKRVFFFFI